MWTWAPAPDATAVAARARGTAPPGVGVVASTPEVGPVAADGVARAGCDGVRAAAGFRPDAGLDDAAVAAVAGGQVPAAAGGGESAPPSGSKRKPTSSPPPALVLEAPVGDVIQAPPAWETNSTQ